MRVLIVEDEPYLAEAIRDGLRLEAIAADVAGDGRTALELLSVNSYDIAVLDRDIPGPSGDEIAGRIVASGSGLPILMLTAADRLDDKASGFELGADDYLTKPFELQELVLRLRALDRRRAHSRPPVREIAGLRLDPFRREVYRDGRYVALDVARSDPDRDNGELVERLSAVNTRAIDLTEALLLLSNADQRSFAREPVDLSLLAEEAAETLLPLAEKHGVTIETSGATMASTVGSRALLLQLVTNLVHNAIVHNLPEHGNVWVTTVADADAVELTVENSGETLTPELVSTLAEPFLRGGERARGDHAGVGLGLAIAQRITQAHEGTLTLTPRDAGGLRVTVRLPAAP